MQKHNFNAIKINHSINEIMKDLRNTSDPIKRAILQKFMDIKVKEIRSIRSIRSLSKGQKNNNDILIDILSQSQSESEADSNSSMEIKKKSSINNHPIIVSNSQTNGRSKVKNLNPKKTKTQEEEVNDIIKRQNQGLYDLDKINAYNELIQENEKEQTKKSWIQAQENATQSDPKYSKFLKEDSMNNKLMERFTSEIDVRNDENKKMPVEKPFEDDDYDENVADTFARFEAPDPIANMKKKITRQKFT